MPRSSPTPKQSAYNFVVAPTYSDQMRVALNWIAKDAGGKAEVAVFHNDSPFGTAPVADGQKWITEKGLQLGYKPYPMPKTPNFVGLLSQAQAQGAKYIVIQNVSSPGRPGRQGHQGPEPRHEDRVPQLVC
jgi:branched-chain amino acid transport system substrate-binding protein